MTPKEGELLTTNIVHCEYQQVEPTAAATNPTFQIQLDDRDPVRTIITDHIFTGLKDGRHEIVVMVVDANNTPIPGTVAGVHFKFAQPAPLNSGSSGTAAAASTSASHPAESHPGLLSTQATKAAQAGQSSSDSTAASAQAPPTEGELPDSGSPLPLLAVLCGGALAGGTLSVIRTRGRRTRS